MSNNLVNTVADALNHAVHAYIDLWAAIAVIEKHVPAPDEDSTQTYTFVEYLAQRHNQGEPVATVAQVEALVNFLYEGEALVNFAESWPHDDEAEAENRAYLSVDARSCSNCLSFDKCAIQPRPTAACWQPKETFA